MVDLQKEHAKQLQVVRLVVDAFGKYAATNDRTLIKKFSNEMLEKTINTHASSRGDRESGWYKAIERELSRRKNRRIYRIALWTLVFAIIGVIIGVINYYK